jgi:ribosome biogenesis SPOUT family RNA methylase Rps3
MKQKRTKPIYVIEHLEPELFDWCLIEYEHISELVGKENLWFTNLKNKENCLKLKNFGEVFLQSISEIIKEKKLQNICVLDPESNKTLQPNEDFNFFIFGGILGDYPPKKRTKKELTRFIENSEVRNIGKEQMSTDNAVYTTYQIANGKKFSELEFKDKVSIQLGKFEFVDLPYRYNVSNNKVYMSNKIKEYLKKKGAFR